MAAANPASIIGSSAERLTYVTLLALALIFDLGTLDGSRSPRDEVGRAKLALPHAESLPLE